jgi:hypothetical protein
MAAVGVIVQALYRGAPCRGLPRAKLALLSELETVVLAWKAAKKPNIHAVLLPKKAGKK